MLKNGNILSFKERQHLRLNCFIVLACKVNLQSPRFFCRMPLKCQFISYFMFLRYKSLIIADYFVISQLFNHMEELFIKIIPKKRVWTEGSCICFSMVSVISINLFRLPVLDIWEKLEVGLSGRISVLFFCPYQP